MTSHSNQNGQSNKNGHSHQSDGNEKGVFIVTGGSCGIGAAIALDAARAGYRVLLTYAGNAGLADGVVAAIRAEGGVAQAVQADTGHRADIDRLLPRPMPWGRWRCWCTTAGLSARLPRWWMRPMNCWRGWWVSI